MMGDTRQEHGMNKDRCGRCGHSWGAHQPAPSDGDQCVHRDMGHDCGCRERNPIRAAEGRAARAAWNSFMGRTV